MTGATLTSGAGGDAAARTLPLPHAAAVSSNSSTAGKPKRLYRRIRLVLDFMFVSILVVKRRSETAFWFTPKLLNVKRVAIRVQNGSCYAIPASLRRHLSAVSREAP